ncbi:MAG TPA: ATP-dependent DNA ligase [Longimicrobiales bacterium]|nr:ATP-dependent DNA ligase [Longimicrobiales bacterium]
MNDVVATSDAISTTSKRTKKLELLSALLQRASANEVGIAVAFLSGDVRQRKLNLGYAAVRDAHPGSNDEPTLTLIDVDSAFESIANVNAGAGSTRERLRLLGDILGRATDAERQFIVRLILGELRQGSLEGLMMDAVARGSRIDTADVRRAHMLSGNLSVVAEAAFFGGHDALSSFGIELFRPLQPMLAQSAATTDEAVEKLGTAALEFKLDGARIQVHKSKDEVRIYSRRLNEVTAAIPEIVAAVQQLPATNIVLDGEVIALQPNGRPHDFQLTMKRFGARLDVEKLSAELPLTPFFFDCLYLDGTTLIDHTGTERFNALRSAVPESMMVRRIETNDVAVARSFMSDALAAGHEGVVAKDLNAPYEAGRRGAGWLKVKSAVTLDLVVIGAEWGHGRREGYLSNLHLGARDAANGGFVMLGKTFKGMTDEMLAWQTKEFQARETGREGITVYVRPEIVVEIAFDDIQASPRYEGGLALRFARVKGYRPDKKPEEADTIETVRTMFEERRTAAAPPE